VKDQHAPDLEELFTIITKYRLKLNPEKCVFGVEADKFLGFLFTERGIETNPEKCAAIIAMRSPISMKEVQQLTRRMVARFRFVSAGGDKGHIYFQCLKRYNMFVWTKECEESFLKLKEYLASPLVLCKLQPGTPLCLYFAITDRTISSVLVQEQDQVQRSIYFVSKVLQWPKVRYQAIEKATLAIVFSARTLSHYFQSFTIIVMTNLPIRKFLQKPDVAGQMVCWAVELLEFDVQYEPRGLINGEVYVDFVVDGSSNQQGSGAGVILEGSNGLLIE